MQGNANSLVDFSRLSIMVSFEYGINAEIGNKKKILSLKLHVVLLFKKMFIVTAHALNMRVHKYVTYDRIRF